MRTGDPIRSVVRAFSILELFTAERPNLSLTEISRELQLDKGTVHRFVRTLISLGYLEQDDVTKTYSLGLRAIRFGLHVLNKNGLRRQALPHLTELARITGCTVNMAVLDGKEILYVARLANRIATPEILSIELEVGSRLPAHCTAMGKALLAWLPDDRVQAIMGPEPYYACSSKTITTWDGLRSELKRIRERGYSTNNQELMEGLQCIAAPVFGHEGNVIAAVNIAKMGSPEDISPFINNLLSTARAISLAMGYQVG